MTSAYVLAIVCESAADLRVAAGLADRILCHEVDWLEPESLDRHRRWQGLEEGDSHLEWHEIRTQATRRGLKAHGHFAGEPGALDARAARLALLLLENSSRRPDAVVLIRDSDRKEEKRKGLEQARSTTPWTFPVVVGLARSNRESWLLAGFDPRSQREEEALADLVRDLGHDPRLKPEGLGDPKPVLKRLLAGSHDRETECWSGCTLATLQERGRANGLAEYLEEIRSRLVPLFRG
jgi:hypothetical protein